MNRMGDASTPAERNAEAALASIGEWKHCAVAYEPAVGGIVSPAHRGVDSQRWRVAVDGDKPAFLLKVLHDDQKEFINIGRSFEATRQAAALGVTPAALFQTANAIVIELLPDEWKTATMDDLRDPLRLEAVIVQKKKIHRSSPFASNDTVFDRLRAARRLVDDAGVDKPADLWWMQKCVEDIEAAIKGAGYDTVPSHADGLASNIMYSADGDVRLVDFDEARNVDPYFEIGILLNEVFAFDSEMLPGLEIFDGAARPQSLARCRLYGIADDLCWGLWGALMDKVSPRGEIEFLKYANWRFLRCRMALRHPGFEEKLRQL